MIVVALMVFVDRVGQLDQTLVEIVQLGLLFERTPALDKGPLGHFGEA